MSGGCRRCCRYGSKEQQKGMAKALIDKEVLFNKAIDALTAISQLGGNLSDGKFISRSGTNDAVYRGQMYVSARAIANEFLSYKKDAENGKYKIKAPKDCVIDDKGDVIKGTWTRENGGHGDFWWRFDGEAFEDD